MSANGVKAGGAWAALEYQQQQQKAVINELCSQVVDMQCLESYGKQDAEHIS